MGALSRTTARSVTVHGISCVPEGISVRSVTAGEDYVSFLYQGDMKPLLSLLASLPITDLTITEPELEEVFMHYYEKEGAE